VPNILTSANHLEYFKEAVERNLPRAAGQPGRDFQMLLAGLLTVIGLILRDQVHEKSPAQGQTHHFGPHGYTGVPGAEPGLKIINCEYSQV
jgi:hypothetical protein